MGKRFNKYEMTKSGVTSESSDLENPTLPCLALQRQRGSGFMNFVIKNDEIDKNKYHYEKERPRLPHFPMFQEAVLEKSLIR